MINNVFFFVAIIF